MKHKVKIEKYDEEAEDYVKETKTLILPEELKADVGDRADQMLNAEINVQQMPNNSRGGGQTGQKATTRIQQKDFSNTVDFIVREMINEYNQGDNVDVDNLTNSSKKELGRHYFNQLETFESKKKVEDEGKVSGSVENTGQDREVPK